MDPYILSVIELSSEIHASPNLSILNALYLRQSRYGHPQIYYDFGIAFFLRNDRQKAREAFIKGAAFGLSYPCRVYDGVLIDAVGQCFAHLLTQYEPRSMESAGQGFTLAYLYLSRCIELVPGQAHDSYKTRAMLLNSQRLGMLVDPLIFRYLGLGILKEPLIIADYYNSATAPGSPHKDLINAAGRLHAYLEDMSIGGRDADEYSLAAMVDIPGMLTT